MRHARVAAGLAGLLLVASAAPTAQSRSARPPAAASGTVTGLTAAPRLARAYDAIFDARFEELPKLLAEACGPAPREACQVLDAVGLWWQIQIDPANRTRDALFLTRIDSAIAQAEGWAAREPARAEASFYVGAAYGARVQWRVLRGERLAAARDGKRIKEALERALSLDPTLDDAHFGLGLYRYYADVAPAVARIVRWLLLLPGGDRAEGLQSILRGRDGGVLVRGEADYQLHLLYLWYEQQPERALDLMEGLRQRHPGNPHFIQVAADIEDAYLHDPSSSLRTYQELLTAARAGTVRMPAFAEATARLGMARHLDTLFETDAAIEQLRAVAKTGADAPLGVRAQALLLLGAALDRMGERGDATSAYRAALEAVPPGDPLEIARRARQGIRNTPDAGTARAYRLSIEGFRALQRGDLDGADRLLTQSLTTRPRDPVTRYRRALLLQQRGDDPGALAVLDPLLVTRDGVPPTIYAGACMDAARIHEVQGTLAQAAALYRTAISVFGIDRRMKDAAERALARLSTPSPASR